MIFAKYDGKIFDRKTKGLTKEVSDLFFFRELPFVPMCVIVSRDHLDELMQRSGWRLGRYKDIGYAIMFNSSLYLDGSYVTCEEFIEHLTVEPTPEQVSWINIDAVIDSDMAEVKT